MEELSNRNWLLELLEADDDEKRKMIFADMVDMFIFEVLTGEYGSKTSVFAVEGRVQ